ncbi:MAG: 2Fe-2S iron-sulfur cluster-binding protein [Rhodospirillales bacterium]|nr:2Fe-2S iron-sulfur cluster-binding protein [Rhodospirillales bacterium]
MFRRTVESTAATISLVVDGNEVRARAGESLAAALLAEGLLSFRRSAVSGVPRGPWCLMGACFECLVTIDGARQRACMIRAVDGMHIETGEGRRRLLP